MHPYTYLHFKNKQLNMKMHYTLLLPITFALLEMAKHTDGISCSDAVNAMIPCGAYLIGAGGNDPSAECCSSAQALNNTVTTVQNRRQLCECLKATGPSLGVLPAFAARLSQVCNLSLNIPVAPDVNCNSISADGYEESTP